MLKESLIAICLALPIIFAATSTTSQNQQVDFFAAPHNSTNSTKNCTGTNSTYKWVYSTVKMQLPRNAVYGGYDKNKQAIFVGRAFQNGEFWPASIVPGKRTAYITVKGKSVIKESYEVLTGDNFSWQMGYDGRVPNGAINTTTNIWIGRANYKDALIVGKVSLKHKKCLVSYDNKEKENNKYEVLVYNGPFICNCTSNKF